MLIFDEKPLKNKRPKGQEFGGPSLFATPQVEATADEPYAAEIPKKKRGFFDIQEAHSKIKAQILEQYVPIWANILRKKQGRVLYIDLFCGPGLYGDGSPSTPLLVLNKIITKPELHSAVVTYFNDADKANVEKLRSAVKTLPGLDSLTFAPMFGNADVTQNTPAEFATLNLVPAFLFFDPFGYKALSAKMIESILKNAGSECIFFFNYNRINAAIHNQLVRPIVDAIFGKTRVAELQKTLPGLDSAGIEMRIMAALHASLKEIGGTYMVPFGFRDRSGRLTHHLVFVGKHALGRDIATDIIGKFSSSFDQGVPSFEYSEAPQSDAPVDSLFGPALGALDKLKVDLLRAFSGRTLVVSKIAEIHNTGRTQYLTANYREALKQLCAEGKVTPSRPHKPTLVPKPPYKYMPDDVSITFSTTPKTL